MIRERARNKLPMQKHVPALSNVVDLSASAKTAQALARATATEPATAQADTTIATVTVQTEADRTTPSAAVKKSAQRSKADEATIRQLAAGIDGDQLKHEKPSKASKRLDETYVSRLRGAMAKDGLSFPPKSAPAQAWFELAHAFGTFLNNTATEADRALLHTDFPALWARFLDETKLSDRIDTTASPEPKAIVQLRSGFAPSDEMP
ncbi:hypothetical protein CAUPRSCDRAFT_12242 [Caulochytrium protostelioides]|uniref:Uncharacterized protein n=1 Tax=Caulochytrium protostelioides TaxID=1555241 RepID=A0A4V1IT73_9FUNG|nr:hypothetical protein CAUPRSCDRAFT_12242 [Caulochytrium protostelioides]